MSLEFEWDSKKGKTNLFKHGVSFDEALTVFRDPLAQIFDDEDHSVEERREIVIGQSIKGKLLLVCFTAEKERVRIFSARKATRRERGDYEENVKS